MEPERDVALWPSRENYLRFRELCDDDVPETFDEFEASAGDKLRYLANQGIVIVKIAFDPDRMATWCRANFGQVNSEARSHYAGFLALSD